jgi:hypothetical protein
MNTEKGRKQQKKKILIQRGQDVFREKFKNLSLALEENMNIPDSTLNFRDEVEWIDTQIFLQKEKMEKTDVDSVIFSARETIEALIGVRKMYEVQFSIDKR